MDGKNYKKIVFRNACYEPIFTIPDKGEIEFISGYDGKKKIKTCTYIDEYHFHDGYRSFHIQEFREVLENNGSRISRPDTKANEESLEEYKVTDRIVNYKGEFLLGVNEKAKEKFAVWQSSLNEMTCYRMFYFCERHAALEYLLNFVLTMAKACALPFDFHIGGYNQEEEAVLAKYRDYLLPEYCYALDENTGEVILIRKYAKQGEPIREKIRTNQSYVKRKNEEIGVSDAQVKAMKNGLFFGWQDSFSFPYRYIVDYAQAEAEYCERYGVTDTVRKGNKLTYYVSYPESLMEPKCTYKVTVNLDTMEESRDPLKNI